VPQSAGQPRHADEVAGGRPLNAFADRDDGADDLMAGDQRELGLGQIAVEDVEVGPAHGAGAHVHEHLAGAGLGLGPVPKLERPPRGIEHLRAHAPMLAG
jgi:hypothetical protein